MTALQPTINAAASTHLGTDHVQANAASAAPAVSAKTVSAKTVSAKTVSAKTWIAVFGATLGAFMAVLNIQIVNASLADIQGAIGAGIDDGGWISTSYLIAEIVVIPLSGWLAQVFSIRLYLLTNAVLFLTLSIACAFAQNLPQMIVLRAIQGFTGGVLIPMAFTLIITLLPKAKQPIGLALFALSATFAPAIGPTIGGYLTENWGWEYIFYVNLVPGAIMIAMLWYSLESKPMKLSLLREGDWAGIATMAIGLSALQTVLEEGNKDDWFASAFIVKLSIVAAVALAAFLWIELTTKKPLLNLRLLVRRNFGFGILANFLLGVALYGSVYVLPVYLSRIQGYNAEQIGMVLAWTGLPQLFLIPLVPQLMKRFDARLIIGTGFVLFATSNFMNIYMTTNYAADQLFWPNIVRAVGQALVFAPLSAVATAGIEAENAGSASGLFNMMRNLGGAVGIAMLQTFLTKREQYHSNVLTQSVSMLEQATRTRIEQLTQYFMNHGVADHAEATHRALVAIGKIVQKQAYILAFSDTFFLLGVALIVALMAALLLKKPDHLASGGAH
jgi:MFS transporter, DHA2 family, multidrug resistance protein